MNSNIDFVTRAHALWRVRMAQWQQRFRFFSTITLGAAATGAIIAPQFLLHGPAITTAVQYAWANVLTLLGSLGGSDIKMNIAMEGQRWTVSAAWFASEPLFTDTFWQVIKVIAGGAITGFVIGLFTVWVLQRTMSEQGKDTLADRVIGGTRVTDEEDVAAQTAQYCGTNALRIGPVPVPRRIETRHFAFLGTTGSGKTTALRQMLNGIERRGEAALVYDTSGEFIAHYYSPARGDIILNPFDARCAFWTPFDEISHPADADRIARQLVSETSSQDDDVWLETSRILVANMIRSLWAEKNCSLEALLEALQVKDKEQLKEWLGHTSSARTFANDAVATDTLSIGSEVPRTTIATQRQFRPAVLESELRLAPHQGYLLLPDGLPVARIGLTADHITRRGEPRQPGYVPGDPAGTLWSRVSEIAKGAEPDAKPGPV